MRISLKAVALLLFLVAPVLAKPPAETAFDEWLDAFNRNERAALTEFNARRFGEPEHTSSICSTAAKKPAAWVWSRSNAASLWSSSR